MNTYEFNAILSHQFTPDEMTAIQYVIDNLGSGEAVAFVGGTYWNQGSLTFMKLAFLGGLLMNQTFSLNGLYGLKTRNATYQKLSAARVVFIYLNLEDRDILRQHAQVYEAVTGLNVAFQNDQVTVYSFKP